MIVRFTWERNHWGIVDKDGYRWMSIHNMPQYFYDRRYEVNVAYWQGLYEAAYKFAHFTGDTSR